ncbi:hypothetical protein B0H19DRAFT_1080059 [Mycena capillaripes]|nr:hypothetical protein B0H19DRAFT_1080059 [Mycena capillaripes]
MNPAHNLPNQKPQRRELEHIICTNIINTALATQKTLSKHTPPLDQSISIPGSSGTCTWNRRLPFTSRPIFSAWIPIGRHQLEHCQLYWQERMAHLGLGLQHGDDRRVVVACPRGTGKREVVSGIEHAQMREQCPGFEECEQGSDLSLTDNHAAEVTQMRQAIGENVFSMGTRGKTREDVLMKHFRPTRVGNRWNIAMRSDIKISCSTSSSSLVRRAEPMTTLERLNLSNNLTYQSRGWSQLLQEFGDHTEESSWDIFAGSGEMQCKRQETSICAIEPSFEEGGSAFVLWFLPRRPRHCAVRWYLPQVEGEIERGPELDIRNVRLEFDSQLRDKGVEFLPEKNGFE